MARWVAPHNPARGPDRAAGQAALTVADFARAVLVAPRAPAKERSLVRATAASGGAALRGTGQACAATRRVAPTQAHEASNAERRVASVRARPSVHSAPSTFSFSDRDVDAVRPRVSPKGESCPWRPATRKTGNRTLQQSPSLRLRRAQGPSARSWPHAAVPAARNRPRSSAQSARCGRAVRARRPNSAARLPLRRARDADRCARRLPTQRPAGRSPPRALGLSG